MPNAFECVGAADERGVSPSTMGRRTALYGLASLPSLLVGPHANARAASAAELLTDDATILVAGPADGHLDQWANVLAPALGRSLPPGTSLRKQMAGGEDGVTAANQFEARVAPDGQTVLLTPGQAALAWLAGDPRARFDAAYWVPVMSGVTPAVVVSRVPSDALPSGAKLRIAAAGPAGPDLAALLAVELLGVEAVPLFNVQDRAAAESAFGAHAVDALFLCGEDVPQRAAALAQAGAQPLFSLGLGDETGMVARDPSFMQTPTLIELARARGDNPTGALFAGWRAAAAAAQLEFALVLPQLAPAALVSLWRRAAAQAAATPELQAAAIGGVRAIAAPAPNLPTVAADADSLLELRRWLASRFRWQPA